MINMLEKYKKYGVLLKHKNNILVIFNENDIFAIRNLDSK